MTVEAVVFDWGGTLTPWHDIDLHAQWYAYAEIYDPEHASALASRLADAESARWQRQRESQGAVSCGALDAMFLDLDIDITSARHMRALGSYLDFWDPHTRADDDAVPLLSALRQEGMSIGVLSNTMWPGSHHREVFQRDGLWPLVDAALYTSELPVAKPHRDAFLAIAEALGVPSTACVFVGDRLWDDITGAAGVGMRTIHVPHSGIPTHEVGPTGGGLAAAQVDALARPGAVVQRLAEVLDVVRGWRATT